MTAPRRAIAREPKFCSPTEEFNRGECIRSSYEPEIVVISGTRKTSRTYHLVSRRAARACSRRHLASTESPLLQRRVEAIVRPMKSAWIFVPVGRTSTHREGEEQRVAYEHEQNVPEPTASELVGSAASMAVEVLYTSAPVEAGITRPRDTCTRLAARALMDIGIVAVSTRKVRVGRDCTAAVPSNPYSNECDHAEPFDLWSHEHATATWRGCTQCDISCDEHR
jgi:hypothetical protein